MFSAKAAGKFMKKKPRNVFLTNQRRESAICQSFCCLETIMTFSREILARR